MRGFLIFVVVIGLGVLYYWQKHHEPAATATVKPAAAHSSSSQSTGSQPSPAPERSVSEHNWMKRSIDRASDVAKQSRQRTQQSQDP
jgi:hypothetical protein